MTKCRRPHAGPAGQGDEPKGSAGLGDGKEEARWGEKIENISVKNS